MSIFRPIHLAAMLALALPAGGTASAAQTYECIIRPSQVVRIGAAVSGIVTEVPVDRGDWVEAGDTVARLDTSLQEMAIQSAEVRASSLARQQAAEARITFLKAKLERNQSLKEQSVVAASAIEEIEADLSVAENDLLAARQDQQVARVELEHVRAERQQRIILSPITGFVTQRAFSPGEFWTGQDPIVVIAGVDELYIEAIVGIEAYDSVHVGSTALVQPEEPVGGRYDATVTVVDQVFDAASGTFGVRLVLPNPGRTIPAGLRCEVSFAPG